MIGKIAILALAACALSLGAAETENWNFGWKFYYGKNPDAFKRDFDDSSWRKLDLPHDYQIEQPWAVPSEEEIKKNGGELKNRGFKPYGEGWYRKEFRADPEWRGKRVILDFEGVMTVSDVYVNGQKAASNEYGYSGYEADISKFLDYGGQNVVAVYSRVMGGSRWYTGGGIFRDVKLSIKNPVAVARHGLYITTPKVGEKSAAARVLAEVENALGSPRKVSVRAAVFGPDGSEIASEEREIGIPANSASTAEFEFEIKNPSLWSPENPALYSAAAEVKSGGKLLDAQRENFGIRKIEFTPERGFLLNGKKTLLKGVNLHHDLGALGAAAYTAELERRIKFLKSIGVNHIRTAHNPFSKSFLDLADKYGILVADELFDKWDDWFVGMRKKFGEVWPNAAREFIRRDRNRPSVVIWSLGNELLCQGHNDEYGDYGVTMYKKMRDFCKKFDATRPYTVAQYPAREGGIKSRDAGWETSKPAELAFATDISSQNYTWGFFEKDAKKYPGMIFYQSEAGTWALGGNYFGMNLDRVVGLAYWGAIGYFGESFGWPSKGWGDKAFIDTALNPLPQCWWVKANFSEGEPVVHIGVLEEKNARDRFVFHNGVNVGLMPETENWNRQKGSKVSVAVYTNADEAELFLNGKSLGAKKNMRGSPAERNKIIWKNIAYEAGELKAVARTDGKTVGEYKIETADEPCEIVATAENPDWKADGMDLQHIAIKAVDKRGNIHPLASNKLKFKVEGSASLIGVDNGDINSNEMHTGCERSLYCGRALAILRAGRSAEKVKLVIEGENLPKKTVILRPNPAK